MTGRADLAIEYERRTCAAIFARDTDAMAGLISGAAFGMDVRESGLRPESGQDLIDGIEALDDSSRFELDDLCVVSVGPDVVVVVYRMRQWGSHEGSALPPLVYASTVWLIDGDRWEAIMHQETAPSDG